MAETTTIFQASDLNQHGRAILDAARRGIARVRDKDGASLVMLPEARVNALQGVARASGNLLTLERALLAAPDRPPDLGSLGDWTWLRVFDCDDLATFVQEVREALIVAAREESVDVLDEMIASWRTTAEALDDPIRRQILLAPDRAEDYVDVARPE